MSISWLLEPAARIDLHAQCAAERRQEELTKPPGSLGRLEEMAVRLAGLQGKDRPDVARAWISVFAADHGVAAQGVSAFPQAVTAEMVRNFARGGAAINVLARQLDAKLEVINLGTVTELDPLPNVLDQRIGPGTADLSHTAAMSPAQLEEALGAGHSAVQRALADNCDIWIGGEMGIANTTSSTALACALLQYPAAALAGPGTGLDGRGVEHKITVVERALRLHASQLKTPLESLRHLGGFEIAALTGAYIACAQDGLPVLVDGFISSVAALTAERICPGVADWFLFSHTSAEPGHVRVLAALAARPLLGLQLRLGEGSGAGVALPLLRLACALHRDMASFAEAGVSNGR